MKREDVKKLAELLRSERIIDSGSNVSIQCPFAPWTHKSRSDNDPSMSLSVNDKGESFYHCFGCKQSGLGLGVMVFKLEDMGFDKARAQRLHAFIESAEARIDKLTSEWEEVRKPTEVNKLGRVHSETTIYDDQLFVDLFGDKVYHPYLEKRGVSRETCEKFGLGFDQRWQRVVMPVRWHTGQIVGAVGRSVVGKDYYNYWKFPRRLVLFGENLLTPDPVVLTEGPFDCMKTRQAGFNAVGILGSELSKEQIDKLVEFAEPVVLFLDGDEPGRDAAKRYRAKLEARGLRVTADVSPPEGIDPGKMSSADIKSHLQSFADTKTPIQAPPYWGDGSTR